MMLTTRSLSVASWARHLWGTADGPDDYLRASGMPLGGTTNSNLATTRIKARVGNGV